MTDLRHGYLTVTLQIADEVPSSILAVRGQGPASAGEER